MPKLKTKLKIIKKCLKNIFHNFKIFPRHRDFQIPRSSFHTDCHCFLLLSPHTPLYIYVTPPLSLYLKFLREQSLNTKIEDVNVLFHFIFPSKQWLIWIAKRRCQANLQNSLTNSTSVFRRRTAELVNHQFLVRIRSARLTSSIFGFPSLGSCGAPKNFRTGKRDPF